MEAHTLTLLAKRTAIVPFIALVAALMLVLTGCSSSGAKTEAVYTQSQAGVSLSITLEAEGDRLVKETTESVLEYEPSGFADKAAAKEALETLMEDFPVIDGMEHSIKYGDKSATERVVIDYTVIDPAELAELNGVPADDKAKDVSFKERSAQLEAGGFEKS